MQTMLYTSSLYAEMDKKSISSRIGVTAPAELYDRELDLFEQISDRVSKGPLHCIFVDEAQFLTRDQVWQLARVCDRLRLPVMCYGLRTDFQGQLFEGSRELLAIADVLREVRTICECGSKATMVVRMDEKGNVLTEGEQVAIGKDVYVSLCRRHWEEYTGRWPAADGESPRLPFSGDFEDDDDDESQDAAE